MSGYTCPAAVTAILSSPSRPWHSFQVAQAKEPKAGTTIGDGNAGIEKYMVYGRMG